MIIDINTKLYETNSDYKNVNWYGDNRNVIDETTIEGKNIANLIIKNYPYFDLILDHQNNITGINIWDTINYTIDKTQISPEEVCTININENVIAIIDGIEYNITDGVIEYSNYNTGLYRIILKTDNKKPTIINIEVI